MPASCSTRARRPARPPCRTRPAPSGFITTVCSAPTVDDLNAAERFYFRAHQVYQECHSKPGLAEVCDSLANLLLRRGKAAYGLTFARQSLEPKRSWATATARRSRTGRPAGRWSSWRITTRQPRSSARILEIARELGDAKGIGIMLNSLGEVALLRGRSMEHPPLPGRPGRPGGTGSTRSTPIWVSPGSSWRPDASIEADAECDRAAAILDAHPGLIGLPDAPQRPPRRDRLAARRLRGRRERISTPPSPRWRPAAIRLDTVPFLYELRDLYQAQQSRAKAVLVMARALDLLSECGSERGVQDVEDWLRTVDTPNLIRLALERHFPSWLIDDMIGGRLRKPPSR